MSTETNSSLSTFRRCPREYELTYERQLVPLDEDDEKLIVGTCWHEAHDAAAKGADPYEVISRTAPSPLWIVKLARLFAAQLWYWRDQPLSVENSEDEFDVEIDGRRYRGKRDGIVTVGGRVGLLERKTTSYSVEADSPYWDRLRLDTQLTLYAATMPELPAFILYDVVRKPTINPKNLTKADVTRITAEFQREGAAKYFGETFVGADVEAALEEKRETPEFYGARLTADIGDRPEHYFARREVARTHDDYSATDSDLCGTVDMVEAARRSGRFPRNPDACQSMIRGKCHHTGLCFVNSYPGPGETPDGYRIRERRHPELS